MENPITTHQEVSVIYAKAASSCEELISALRKLAQPRGVGRAVLLVRGRGRARLLCLPGKERGGPSPELDADPFPALSQGNLCHTLRCRLSRRRVLH